MSSIGFELPKEMARVRDHLIPMYDGLPDKAGMFASTLMRAALDQAATALAEGDIIKILRSYETLKAFKE